MLYPVFLHLYRKIVAATWAAHGVLAFSIGQTQSSTTGGAISIHMFFVFFSFLLNGTLLLF